MIKIPKSPNDESRLSAARIIAQDLIDDAGLECDIEEIAADVAKYCRYGDGFQMAKDLEHFGWDCDMRIAEVLDNFSSIIDREHKKFLAKFAKDNAIEPPLPVSTAVKTSRGTGIITGIYEHRPLSYLVKMDGNLKAEPPTNSRSIVYFDEVEAA